MNSLKNSMDYDEGSKVDTEAENEDAEIKVIERGTEDDEPKLQ